MSDRFAAQLLRIQLVVVLSLVLLRVMYALCGSRIWDAVVAALKVAVWP